MYPGKGTVVLIRPAQTFYERITLEFQEQLSERGVQRAHIYIVNGHGQAGLHLGAKLLGLPWRVTGVAVGQDFEIHRPLSKWSEQTAEHLKLPVALSAEEIDTTFDFEGEGFGVPDEACMEAMALAARTRRASSWIQRTQERPWRALSTTFEQEGSAPTRPWCSSTRVVPPSSSSPPTRCHATLRLVRLSPARGDRSRPRTPQQDSFSLRKRYRVTDTTC